MLWANTSNPCARPAMPRPFGVPTGIACYNRQKSSWFLTAAPAVPKPIPTARLAMPRPFGVPSASLAGGCAASRLLILWACSANRGLFAVWLLVQGRVAGLGA